jgi:predicted alpha/beta hydrolase family esterase
VTITSGGTPASNNAAFASVSEFTAVNPGDVTIAVSEGSINASRTITVEQKKVYTVLLVSGASTADPAQIKFISNGTLDDEAGQRSVSSAQIVSVK